MKLIYLSIALFLSIASFAQINSKKDTPNRHIQPPQNDYCSANTLIGTTINFWDWTSDTFTIFRKEDTNIYEEIIASPFHINGYSNSQPNVDHLRFVTDKDYESSDGWELIYKDFGTSSIGTAYPSYALYNRYSGLMRIFFYIVATETTNFQSAILNTSHLTAGEITTKSAILQQSNPIMNSISTFEPIDGIHNYNTYNESIGSWLISEFVTSYDPCTCDNATVIRTEPKLISVSSVSLQADGTSFSEIVYNGATNTSNVNGFSSILGSVSQGIGIIKKGQSVFTSLNKFSTYLYSNLSQYGNSDCTYNDIPVWMQGLPYIGTALSVLNQLIGGGGSTKTMTGFSTKYHFDISGTITTEAPFQSSTFFNPGSKYVSFGNTIRPKYNNPLGLFNILSIKSTSSSYYESGGYGYSFGHSFKVDDISYVVNSSAGIKKNPKNLVAALFFPHPTVNGEPASPVSGLIQVDATTFRTPFLPLDCLYDYGLTYGFSGGIYSGSYGSLGSWYVKVIATLEPLDTSVEDIIYMASYHPSEENVIGDGTISTFHVFPNSFEGLDPLELEEDVESLGCTFIPPATIREVENFCEHYYPQQPSNKDTSDNDNVKDQLKVIKLYPNPVDNTLFVEGVTSRMNYSIINQFGEIKKQGIVNGLDVNSIALSNSIQRGVYIIRFISENTTPIVIRFVKN